MIKSLLDKLSGYAPVLLRVGVGLIFLFHGWDKLHGISGVGAFFGSVGIPFPHAAAWLVACIEFFGGLLVVLGVYTRVFTSLMVIIMLVVITVVKWSKGLHHGYELEFLLLLSSFSLVLLGDGPFSLGKFLPGGNSIAENETIED